MEKANIVLPHTYNLVPKSLSEIIQQALIPDTFLTSHRPPGFVRTLSAFLALLKPFSHIINDHQNPVLAAELRQRKEISLLLQLQLVVFKIGWE